MRRIVAAAAAGAALALALSGCASAGGAPAATVTPSPGFSATPAPAVDLLPTVWHVHGAKGADPATYLLFSADEAEVLEPKGSVQLAWSTQGDRMLAMVQGWSGSLGTSHEPTVPWLTAATTFRRTGDGWVLLDADAHPLATLTDDGPAPAQKDTVTTPEPVTSVTRGQLADAVAGPGTATVPAGALVGRWGVDGLNPKHGTLTLTASGTWTITGDCSGGFATGESGDYRTTTGGFLLQTALPVADVGCAPVLPHPPADSAALTRFSEARSMQLSGDHLTLFDQQGKRIGTLTRVP